ncbi:MAG TPA: hypothetical protein VHX17_09480 [Candidatus Cybelea sp.]|jgi:hypothetical protein|nr:hypothetical protein [Candidatus Cybelea sp.]
MRSRSLAHGRPRKGAELREVFPFRMEPETVEKIKDLTGKTLAEVLESVGDLLKMCRKPVDAGLVLQRVRLMLREPIFDDDAT